MSKKEQIMAILKKQYYERNPQIAVQDILESQQMLPLLEKLVNGLKFVTPKLGVDYLTESEKAVLHESLYSKLREAIKDGAPGHTPTEEELKKLITPLIPDPQEGMAGKTPVCGIDYFTKNDVDIIVNRVIELIPKPKEVVAPDIAVALEPHLEAFKKNLPNNDSILVSILKDPRLRMLLHGGRQNLTAGSNVTITQNGDGSATITSTGGSGFTTLAATETPNGVLKIFTFALASAQPSYIVSDNVWLKAVAASGTINWTWNNGTKKATLTIPSVDDIWSVV